MNFLKKAWEVRLSNFPRQIHFVKPQKTLALSLTGQNCELNCPHCEGHYLKSMKAVDSNEKLDLNFSKDYTSCLVSGGSCKDGKVPFAQNETLFNELKKNKVKINLHPGLVSESEAQIASQVDVCSFDFIVDEKVIKHVYGLDKTPEDFIKSYGYLSKYVNKIVPHINIGIPGGDEEMEMNALEVLQDMRLDALTFIIFTPTPKTSLQHHLPPKIAYVEKVLASARIMFPDVPIFLGCMRPGGNYRQEVDEKAFLAGVNKIVSPTPGVKKLAGDVGFNLKWSKECCAI